MKINIKNFVKKRKIGFTLAETLITIGVIGIVAAMTLPAVVAKYNHKILEVRFKKAYSEISQISRQVSFEYNYCARDNSEDIKKFILSKYKSTNRNIKYDTTTLKNYLKQPSPQKNHFNCLTMLWWENPVSFLPVNGMSVALCSHNDATLISVDTNTDRQGPNAYGHDVFLFRLAGNPCLLKPVSYTLRDCVKGEEGCFQAGESYAGWKEEAAICSQTSNNTQNGIGCFKYAVSGECPFQKGKSYWECLP